MDEEIKEMRRSGRVEEKRAVMSDVVPIGGLVMARFHIVECELQSIQMRWPKRFKATAVRSMPSPSSTSSLVAPSVDDRFSNTAAHLSSAASVVTPPAQRRSVRLSSRYSTLSKDFTKFVLDTSPPAASSSCAYVLNRSNLKFRYRRMKSQHSGLRRNRPEAFMSLRLPDATNDEVG